MHMYVNLSNTIYDLNLDIRLEEAYSCKFVCISLFCGYMIVSQEYLISVIIFATLKI